MSLPTPYIHPDETASHTFWSEDGVWWNADVVDGGTLDLRVYGRQYQSGTPVIQWIIDTREDELESLETLLLEQAGEDSSTARSLSLAQATERNKKGKGNGHGHAGKKEHRDGAGALGGSEDPIKSIKGIGENRASDLGSCLLGNASTCSTDLTTEYPRDPA